MPETPTLSTSSRRSRYSLSPAISNPGSDDSDTERDDARPKFGRSSKRDTEETSSDAFSADGPYKVIEYDLNDSQLLHVSLSDLEEFRIEENTPAAEAIKANATVHVSTIGKAARAMNMQSIRRFAKRVTGQGRSGLVKGKPPRIPPHVGIAGGAYGGNLQPVLEMEEHEIAESATLGQMDLQEQMSENGHIPDSVVAGTVEASKKVLGNVDPHDLLKVLRWKRKNGSGEKQQKSYVKGKVIDGEHELYALSIAVMIGVRTSITKTNTEIHNGPERRWVRPIDFRTTQKYEFRPKGGGTLPPHQLAHTFKFKDYSPVVFSYLRRLSGVNELDFLLSVCGNANFIEFISNAKSGQFFFYSSDGRFMIKTMTNAESKFLRRVLPDYFRHCIENPNTMVTKFLGMYRVKLYHLRRNVKFVIMNSVYFTDKYLQIFYDLKGSTMGRDAKPGHAVKKDNDLRRGLPNEALALAPGTRAHVKEQLVSDCEFLRRTGVMDYSMLVGVHHIPHSDDRSFATAGFKGSRSSRFRKPRPDDGSYGDSSASCNEEIPSSPRPLTRVATIGSTGVEGIDEEGNVRSSSDALLAHRREVSDPIGMMLLEDGLEDDDSSYLLGSDKRPRVNPYNPEAEKKKLATVEKMYWPFHRLYDIHGYRLIQPAHCPLCSCAPCSCHEEEDAKILKGCNIPKFVAPLSDRKDGGLEMDTEGIELPIMSSGQKGPILCCGKIFYMGIIDVLQEYTSRKALETQYRYLQTQGRPMASSVPPLEYGQRFLEFFDEYTQRQKPADIGVELNEEGNIISQTDPF